MRVLGQIGIAVGTLAVATGAVCLSGPIAAGGIATAAVSGGIAYFSKSESSPIREEENIHTLVIIKGKESLEKLERQYREGRIENIEEYSPEGFTPLQMATNVKNHLAIKFLLDRGADCDLPTKNTAKLKKPTTARSIAQRVNCKIGIVLFEESDKEYFKEMDDIGRQ